MVSPTTTMGWYGPTTFFSVRSWVGRGCVERMGWAGPFMVWLLLAWAALGEHALVSEVHGLGWYCHGL